MCCLSFAHAQLEDKPSYDLQRCTCTAVRRHEQLAGEHQAAVSEAQQLRSQNASLVDQVLSLTSQLNTEKVKCEQQLRAVRIRSKRCSDLEQHQQYLEQQVHSCHELTIKPDTKLLWVQHQ